MKKLKILLSVLIIINLLWISYINVNATWTSYSSGYNTPILDNSLNFQAYEKDWMVYTSWNKYSKDESFKYYKVVKSTTTTDPVYPDNGYIMYSSDVNLTSYLDSGTNKEITYYRVCAITNSNNRYCSNVVKIVPSKTTTTTTVTPSTTTTTVTPTTTTTSTSKLNYNLKLRADKLVDDVMTSLKAKNYSDAVIIEKLDNIISKLETLWKNKPSYKILTDYLISKFQEKRLDYDSGLDEIKDLFKDL